LRAAITERDIAYSGSRNPMLKRHGEDSEARQYSGRMVGKEWKCPFSAQGN
jgi:FPC/CPF motif-containing protein YcgG